VCGEHFLRGWLNRTMDGSSPRVRGTYGYYRHGAMSRRFIPACAGNMSGISLMRSTYLVHPRVCGEHNIIAITTIISFGSSPRVRGTCHRAIFIILCNRFIPACAGNIILSATTLHSVPVHPRVCGEHATPVYGELRYTGSSPRVRGTLYQYT